MRKLCEKDNLAVKINAMQSHLNRIGENFEDVKKLQEQMIEKQIELFQWHLCELKKVSP